MAGYCPDCGDSWGAHDGPCATDKEKADAQALADVRTLDDWKAKSPERSWAIDGDNWFWCRLGDWSRVGICGTRGFDAATPDEARAKAAAWVREQAKKGA